MINKQDGTAWARSLDTSVPFIKIVGGGWTGKTLGLAQRVAFLLEKGVATADIVVFCSTLSAADQFESLLGTLAGATDVEVCTVAQYAVDMLGQPRVKAVTGRNPRILAEFEQSILMEDMKVCGLKPKRLREMLKFFYKEICELRDKDDDFIRDSEEQDVYETLMENLRLRDAMLPQELSNVALRFMREHPVEAAAFKRDFVLVDDHMNLNLASQGLVEAIANRNLTIAGSLNSQVATMEPSPNPKGFNTFELAHEGVEVVTLSKGLRCPDRITAMANALVTSLNADDSASKNRKLLVFFFA